MTGYKLGNVASTTDGYGFHILRADNSLVVHFNFKTEEKARIARERLAGMIGEVQSMMVYTPLPHPYMTTMPRHDPQEDQMRSRLYG